MDARNDSRDTPAGRKRRQRDRRCAACGGELEVLVEVSPAHPPDGRDRPFTAYFRCARCGQIQIVDV